MDVKHLLHSGGAIRQEEIDAFTTQIGNSDPLGQYLSDSKYVGASLGLQVSKAGGMSIGDDQEVTRVDRLDVHEGSHQIVSIDDGRFRSALKDFTENAGVHGSIKVNELKDRSL